MPRYAAAFAASLFLAGVVASRAAHGRGRHGSPHHGAAHDGRIKLSPSEPDLHPRAPWHNAHNSHAYEVSADPASLPPLADVAALNAGGRHARARARGAHGAHGARSAGRALQGACGVPRPGCTSSTACAVTSGQCAVPVGNVSSASTTVALTYNTSTGVFSGAITTTQCPMWPADFQYNGSFISHPVPVACETQAFPAENYTFPAALPLGGRIGLAIRSGENVYGSLDQGFTLGQVNKHTRGA